MAKNPPVGGSPASDTMKTARAKAKKRLPDGQAGEVLDLQAPALAPAQGHGGGKGPQVHEDVYQEVEGKGRPAFPRAGPEAR